MASILLEVEICPSIMFILKPLKKKIKKRFTIFHDLKSIMVFLLIFHVLIEFCFTFE